ncbi:deoxyguanosinetriphosphate triphosphohydrolase [Lichenifustis flavocetrariae]|uniref:Deoxyguanosinetriphosphate triphosphohydrolase-like protein n=1 Tax=Lichenifustis flavocetrariae TaxID=2949735 RepID=A0AA41Z5F7_9HYPH|nr:deoxyguanosinetriphosphate triphosphohydrolase [Lichenifustis flavocetrariae]MCW6510823.1 deoxyguanosinetriphosphate triphosphohydrolase [Lichenifustis flavocetrariae]
MTLPSPSRAPYAADPERGRGRRIPETSSATRTAFQRDRDRIVHSSAFRRLALKTQVFLPEQGDHYRTRLTHTIEVAQIARTIARALGLDDDLTEALALAHDLGHTPFGHTGEDALDAVMRPFGGFDHNAQTLRILTLIERRYPNFDGLNLTWDTLDGLISRGGDPVMRNERQSEWHRQGLACFHDDDSWSRSFSRFPSPSAEAQVAAVADDIAYNAHDMEDGLEAGLFSLDDLREVALPAQVKAALRAASPGLPDDLLVRGLTRELVGIFVEDAIAESRRRLADARPDHADAVRSLSGPVVALSPAMAEASDRIKSFLFAHMYRHPRLVSVRIRARQIVKDLAEKYVSDPLLLPPEWRTQPDLLADPRHCARRVSDYIAGMTDRFAVADHQRLFDDTPDLR